MSRFVRLCYLELFVDSELYQSMIIYCQVYLALYSFANRALVDILYSF